MYQRWVELNHAQQRARRMVRLVAPLLPIAYGAQRELKATSKLLLGEI